MGAPIRCYRFDRFELQPAERRLVEAGSVRPLRPLAFDVLAALVDRAGHLVTKDELLQRVWRDVVVEENALQAHVSALRKVLGPQAIATVSGQGYRFALAVTPVEEPAQAPAAPRHRLPQALTRFIGREQEIAEVRRLLGSTRLLTLTGAGGCGKTRLALQVAHAVHETYPDGTWLVELAPLTDPTLIAQVLARELAVDVQPGQDAVDAVSDWLASRRLLLVLDNAEHLVDASARLADRLLRRCAGLTVLATSRERLGVDGELSYRVPPLATAPGPLDEDLLGSEAVQLFIDRARLRSPGFQVTDGDAAVLASICRRLDGIPLAIELAAARVGMMPLEALRTRLDDRFRVLTGGSRTTLPRHRTLRSLIDWSHELLDDAQRAVLRRASVFAGGWTLEVAERVCSGNGVDPEAVLDLLTSLVDKNLVVADLRGQEPRFGMLETVRLYALEQLRTSGEEARARERQLAFLIEMAAAVDVPDAAAALQAASRLDAEHDNLRAVLAWCASEPARAVGGLHQAGLLGMFWLIRSPHGEELAWLARLLDTAPAGVRPDLRAMALNAAAICQLAQGDQAEARRSALASVSLYRQLGERRGLGRALTTLGEADVYLGDAAMACRHVDEALSLAREVGDRRDAAYALTMLALAAYQSGDLETAQARVAEALGLGQPATGSWVTASPYVILAGIRRDLGDHEGAGAAVRESLKCYRECGHRTGVSVSLMQLARGSLDTGDLASAWIPWREAPDWMPGGSNYWVEWLDTAAGLVAASGRTTAAARLWGCVQGQRERRSIRWRSRSYVAMQDAARAALADDAAFDRALAEGRTWTLDEGARHARALDPAAASGKHQETHRTCAPGR